MTYLSFNAEGPFVKMPDGVKILAVNLSLSHALDEIVCIMQAEHAGKVYQSRQSMRCGFKAVENENAQLQLRMKCMHDIKDQIEAHIASEKAKQAYIDEMVNRIEETFAPPPITGYRKLSSTEVDLINEVKAVSEIVGKLVEKLRGMNGISREGQTLALDQRWVSIGETDLQKGFMSLSRSIAKPTTF
jgi:hypothetical protein